MRTVTTKITPLPVTAGNQSIYPSNKYSRVALALVIQLSNSELGEAMNGLRPRYTNVRVNIIVNPELM